MTFPVDITGVQALIELFQQNYDVFHGFLEMYVPGAICLAAGLGPADFVPWAVEIDDEAFRARFADARSRLDATGKGRIPFGSTFGAWAITNFTLVVPVALATLLLYWALVALATSEKGSSRAGRHSRTSTEWRWRTSGPALSSLWSRRKRSPPP
jgi:hypothetical protein